MERCDFSSVVTIIRRYIREDQGMNQLDFMYELFNHFICSDAAKDFDFDNGLVCRWMNGQAKVSPRITGYYWIPSGRMALAEDIRKRILPCIVDSGMVIEKIHGLLMCDNTISAKQKREVSKRYPCETERDEAAFIADVLSFGMSREFIRRAPATKRLLLGETLSPALSDYVFGCEPPKPCRHFCGRDREIEQLHELLETEGKVFLHGIAGIGKSELAKAYAQKYKKEYTNILYVPYLGSLSKSIFELDFADDSQGEDEAIRLIRHVRLMKLLKEDTLLIIDNFNVTAMQDDYLSVVMAYNCHVLFTTRSYFENYPRMVLEEIKDRETLIDLMGKYYTPGEQHGEALGRIIDAVHGHMLAVELAARLLQNGMLEPEELADKLERERASLDAQERINITKDGKPSKETYYGHIHTLFGLFHLSQVQQDIMRTLTLIPETGISLSRLSDWLCLKNLNDVNDLVEMGFVTSMPIRSVLLHPMIGEVARADLKPSITRCWTFCEKLYVACICQGVDIPHYKLLFQTIENIIAFAEKDDPVFYLKFLEDSYLYMEKYEYKHGMKTVCEELQRVVIREGQGDAEDRALLMMYLANEAHEAHDLPKALELDQMAIGQLPEITADNMELASNLYSNLGLHYYESKQYEPAYEHMTKALVLQNQCNPGLGRERIAQTCNFAQLLCAMNRHDEGISRIKELLRMMEERGIVRSSDYAFVQEMLGVVYVKANRMKDAKRCFETAYHIYELVWGDSPELIGQKRMLLEISACC